MKFLFELVPVVGMFLDERNENFVGELAGLPKFRIGADDNVLFTGAAIELDLLCACWCSFWIVTEERAGDAQQIILHVELVVLMSLLRSVVELLGLHKV
jgi:hypothetical protein